MSLTINIPPFIKYPGLGDVNFYFELKGAIGTFLNYVLSINPSLNAPINSGEGTSL